jgi:hypothetical protein
VARPSWAGCLSGLSLLLGGSCAWASWCPAAPTECIKGGYRTASAEPAAERVRAVLRAMSTDCEPFRELMMFVHEVHELGTEGCQLLLDAETAWGCALPSCVDPDADDGWRTNCRVIRRELNKLESLCKGDYEERVGFVSLSYPAGPAALVASLDAADVPSDSGEVGPGVHWRFAGEYRLRFSGMNKTPVCTVAGRSLTATSDGASQWSLPVSVSGGANVDVDCEFLVPLCFADTSWAKLPPNLGKWLDPCWYVPLGEAVRVGSLASGGPCRHFDGCRVTSRAKPTQTATAAAANGECAIGVEDAAGYDLAALSSACCEEVELTRRATDEAGLPLVIAPAQWSLLGGRDAEHLGPGRYAVGLRPETGYQVASCAWNAEPSPRMEDGQCVLDVEPGSCGPRELDITVRRPAEPSQTLEWAMVGGGLGMGAFGVLSLYFASEADGEIERICGPSQVCSLGSANVDTTRVLDLEKRRNTWGGLAIGSGVVGAGLLGAGLYGLLSGPERVGAPGVDVQMTLAPSLFGAKVCVPFR